MLLRIEDRVLRLEYRGARRIFRENDLYLEFITIEQITPRFVRLPLFVQEYIIIFHINVQIVGLELKS